MTEIIKSSNGQPAPELEADFPIPTEAGHGNHITKAAAIGAAGVLAAGGLGYEAGQARAAPSEQGTPSSHTQGVGEQPITTGEFLKTARVSATELLKIRDARERHLASAKQEKVYPNKPEQYTMDYLAGMREGKIPFGYFNGSVVVDSGVKIYSCIDPELKSSSKDSCLNQYPWWNAQELAKNPKSTFTDTRNKFGGGFRPATIFDSKNNPWLVFSIESGGFRANEGTGESGHSYERPPNVQLDLTFFIPFKGNEGHLWFYLSEPNQPVFLAGAISNWQGNPYGGGNFSSLTPNFQTEKPDFFAEWTTAVRDGKSQSYTNGSTAAPSFVPKAWLATLVTNPANGKPYKKYKMPSAAKIKKLIQRATPTSD